LKYNKVYINHILDEIDFVINESKELRFDDLVKDKVLKRAIIRSLEIIGEATKNISNEFREKYPDVEWKKMAGIRDKLIHEYFGIDWNIVWDIVNNQIPRLNEKIRNILKEIS